MLPLLLIVVLGVVEVSYALLDQHVVTKLTREGSNLISRDTSLADAATALKSMSGRPVDFTIELEGDLLGGQARRDDRHHQLQQGRPLPALRVRRHRRHQPDLRPAAAAATAPARSTRPTNADGDTNIQVTNLPAGIALSTGGMIYITEIFTTHS